MTFEPSWTCVIVPTTLEIILDQISDICLVLSCRRWLPFTVVVVNPNNFTTLALGNKQVLGATIKPLTLQYLTTKAHKHTHTYNHIPVEIVSGLVSSMLAQSYLTDKGGNTHADRHILVAKRQTFAASPSCRLKDIPSSFHR